MPPRTRATDSLRLNVRFGFLFSAGFHPATRANETNRIYTGQGCFKSLLTNGRSSSRLFWLRAVLAQGCFGSGLFWLTAVSAQGCFGSGLFRLKAVSAQGCFGSGLFRLKAVSAQGCFNSRLSRISTAPQDTRLPDAYPLLVQKLSKLTTWRV